jgi:Autotransporter beta-domain
VLRPRKRKHCFGSPDLPAVTIAANPSTLTFSAAGEVINYSFPVTNTGNVALSNLSVSSTGGHTGAVSCPVTTLAIGASVNCTSAYTTVASDVGSNIPYSVTATANSIGTLIATSVPATGSIAYVAQPTVTLSAPIPSVTSFSRVGEVITFSYPFTTGAAAVPNVCVVDTTVPNIVCPAGPFAPNSGPFFCTGIYTTTAADVLKGSISTNAGIAVRPAATGACNATPSIQSKTPVVLNAAQVAQNAARGINNFLVRRAEVTAGAQPDTSRQHARLTGCMFGSCGDEEAPAPAAGFNAGSGSSASLAGGSSGQDLSRSGLSGLGLGGVADDDLRRPTLFGKSEADGEQSSGPATPGRSSRALGALGFTGQSGEGNSRFGFSTSLDQIRRETERSRSEVLGYSDSGASTYRQRPATFDVWAQGNWASYEDKRGGTKISGDGGALMFGADYRVTPAILIGIMGSIDQINDKALTQIGAADGKGWMYGPYASVRLTRNVFLDIRGAWGGSDNKVDPTGGAFKDSFSTDRALYSAKLTGNYAWGAFRIRPSAEVLHYEEKQKAFLSQIGVLVPGQTVTLGRLTFGPEFSYKVVQHDGSMFEPFVGLKGIWDFDKTQSVNLIDGGVTFRSLRGVTVRASASYDGIGDNSFHAIREQVTVTVPLN